MDKDMEKHLQRLLGGTITGLVVDDTDDFDDDMWALTIKTRSGGRLMAWILADAEGNGPGFLALDAPEEA
jgi:tRNA(Met) C34 N-acetyltransferase TmcA